MGRRASLFFAFLLIASSGLRSSEALAEAVATPVVASPSALMKTFTASQGLGAVTSPGLWLTGVQPDNSSQLPMATGATWVRLTLSWNVVEPTQGSFNWGAYDAEFQQAASLGYRVIATLRDYPAWTNTSSDPANQSYQCRLDPSQFGAFENAIQKIVSRYSAKPYSVADWEIGNEPDNDDSSNRYNTMNCYGGQPYADTYAHLLQAVYPVIKGVNPNNQVLIGGLGLDWFDCDNVTPGTPGHFDPNFLGRILAAGAGNSFDVMNVHYYPNFRVRWEGYGPDVAGKLAWVEGVLARHGLSKPIIVSEAGAVSNLYGDTNYWQSRYVAQLYSRAAAAGASTVVWFNLVDETGDTDNDNDEYLDTDNDGDTNQIGSNHGLFFDYGQTHPAKQADTAFQTFAAETNGATYVRPLSQSDTGYAPTQVEGYEFRGMASKHRVWVLWTFLDVCASEPSFAPMWSYTSLDSRRRNCSGQQPPLQYSVTLKSTPLHVSDEFGNSLGSPSQISVGLNPIYIEFDDPGFTGMAPSSPVVPALSSDFPNLACYPPRAYIPAVSNGASGGW